MLNFLALIAMFCWAGYFSFLSLDASTRFISGLLLLPALITYVVALNSTINMIIKPFMRE